MTISQINEYILTTERLGLRKWKESDLEIFSAMNRDAEVMRYFPNMLTDQQTRDMVQRINLHFEKYQFGLFAVEDLQTKQFLGYTGFLVPVFEAFFTPCVEIGWRFKKEAWGKGFATEAAEACLDYGFRNLGFNRVVSFTSIWNEKSENVMRRIGMRPAGEFDHPLIGKEHILCRHLLYEIDKPEEITVLSS